MPTEAVRTGTSLAESFAGADPEADAQRARALRRMKAVALSFLIGATVIFLACRWGQAHGGPAWIGYVGAAAEAGMVGALADWFAVTALFRHPLGLKIPHTAIIKRKKDQLGEGLGTFVRENFLSPAVVETKLRDAEVAGRLGKWLSEPSHAERVATEAGTVLRVVVELLNDDDIQQVIDRTIVRRLAEPQWGPPVGRVLGQLLAENRQEALIQLLCDRAFQWALNAGDTIERVVTRDSPSWSPKFVDQLVGDRIHRELMDFTDKVRRDPNHELRQSANRFLFEFASDLQNDDATIARAEAVKEQLMERDEVARAAETAWKTLKRLVLEGVDDPKSTLRTRVTESVMRIGESLRDDAELRDKVDNWIVRGAQHLVAQYGAEITTIITDTIERWDADEASRRIELHVGRDLQFIRINGTVVGSLAGLIIYTVAQLLF
ncbi:membrane protein [Mycolicibacterium aromaticivorans JS19b1 = JCM 16368]|uniref:Membrane protein n=1 Tax=Mycolicibacterium aromaticivorans JS19b1 = JCM 16368 TaxID=1440774 RepID=A0A064CJJ7_9MYCO|nr:membrane protein [Mycolicibacterium aromaticivorans JS19b1 = JCM 16368]